MVAFSVWSGWLGYPAAGRIPAQHQHAMLWYMNSIPHTTHVMLLNPAWITDQEFALGTAVVWWHWVQAFSTVNDVVRW